MFDKYNDYFYLYTNLSSRNYHLNNNCIKRRYKDVKITYCKYILECKLVINNIAISLDSE